MGKHAEPNRTPGQRLGATISKATFAALDAEELPRYATGDRIAYLVGAEPTGTARLMTGMLSAVDVTPAHRRTVAARIIDLRCAL